MRFHKPFESLFLQCFIRRTDQFKIAKNNLVLHAIFLLGIYCCRFKDLEISASTSQTLNPLASLNLFKLSCFSAASLVQILGVEIEISRSLNRQQYIKLHEKPVSC